MLDDQDVCHFRDYDLVVCNPPYISEEDFLQLPNSVRSYETRGALVGHAEGDGLAYYRRLALLVDQGLLRPSECRPQLVMEVGSGSSAEVLRLFSIQGEVWHDFAGHDRVVALPCTRTSQGEDHVQKG